MYEHIVAELSPNYSQFKFSVPNEKDSRRIHQSYKIASDEKILAYLLKTTLFGKVILDGIVITDKALYVNPSTNKGKSSNRLALSKLCQYIVLHPDDNSSVTLLESLDVRYEALHKTIIDLKNGNEIHSFLQGLQAELLKTQDNVVLRNSTVEKIIAQCRHMLEYSGLSEDARSILEALYKEPAYCSQAVELTAEDAARKRPDVAYNLFITLLPSCIPEDTRNQLISRREEFLQRFTLTLENIDQDISINYLNDVYKSLEGEDQPSEIVIYLRGLLSIHTGHFSELADVIQNLASDEKIQRLRFLQGIYSNKTMEKVFDSIKLGKEDTGNYSLDSSDSMGLTPLHYALILHQNELVEKFLDKKEWVVTSARGIPELESIYSYLNLARFLRNPHFITLAFKIDIIRDLSEKAKVVSGKIDRRRRLLQTHQSMVYSVQQALQYPSSEEDGSNQEDLEYKLERSLESIEIGQEEIENLQYIYQEIKEEIDDELEKLMTSCDETVEKWRHCTDPLIKYLIHLYSDPDFLYKVLHEKPENCELYHYGDFYFVAPKDAGIFSNSKEKRQETADTDATQISKPYGNSWFSPNAHRNIKLLRKEYHLLAKKYHPDVSGSLNSTAIFQDIINEQMTIVEKLYAN